MTADTVGGVWTYALELAHALEPHDVRIALATMGASLRPEQRAEVDALRHVEVFESRYKLEWMERPWDDVAAAGAWLLGIARAWRPNLVHLGGYAHGALPWRVPVLVVAHSCVYSWFEAVKGTPPPPVWERYREAVRRGLYAADLVAAPTRAMAAALRRHYGLTSDVRVVLNGRGAHRFPPQPKEPIVLAAGRIWDEAKNIQALASVAERLPWPVCLAGDDHHPDGGTARFEEVRMLGRLAPDALAAWMGRASLFALPVRYEPFGLSPLEAALAGCALVLGDLPSLREVWGDAALFVPPEDHEALEKALQTLIADEPLRRRYAAQARRRALALTPERTAQGYLDLYQQLLAERSMIREA